MAATVGNLVLTMHNKQMGFQEHPQIVHNTHCAYARGGYRGGALGAQAPPLSQDNIQESIDIWLSYQLKHPPYSQETLI